MKYAVAWLRELLDYKAETCDFCFEEDDCYNYYDVFCVDAKDKREAAKKYILMEYDRLNNSEENFVPEMIIDWFIRDTFSGDIYHSIPEHYETQKEILALADEIYDYYIECLMMDGKIKITKRGDKVLYSTPSNDDEYVEKALERFPPECLTKLLSEEQKKELYVEAGIYDVAVIPLKPLRHK